MINNLGHKLVIVPNKEGTFRCIICNSLIWKSICYDERFMVSIGDDVWKYDITCDEMIIKGIIE